MPVQSFPPASGLRDNSICANPQPQGNIAIQGDQTDQTAPQMVEDFMKALKINVEELATIEEGGKSSKASIFYLHFPSDDPEVKAELQLLQVYLGYHEKIVLTSDNPGDWTKFVQNSRQGVAIVCDRHPRGYDCETTNQLHVVSRIIRRIRYVTASTQFFSSDQFVQLLDC
jgi:chromo domain-containing protein 1